jgi:type I restriction enzyme S subunit
MKKNWEIKTLGEVCDFYNGKAHENCVDENGKYHLINSKFVSSNGLISKKTNSQLFPLFKDDIVFVMSDVPKGKTLAKCYFVEEDNKYTLNQRICVFRNSKINVDYLCKYINRNNYFLEFDNGENQTNLRKEDILKCPIYIPPIKEQEEIVERLDKGFALIEELKETAKKNLENAKELFQSVLREELSPKEGWETKDLGKICEVKDGTHDSPKYVNEGIPFITQKNITINGFDMQNARYITITDHEKFYKRSNVTKGDILISMIGANRGMSCIVDSEEIFSIKNVGLIKENDTIKNKYLLYYLKSPKAQKYVLDNSNGGAQEFVGLTVLRAFPIDIPKTIKEQEEIVGRLDRIKGYCEELEGNYKRVLELCEELKQGLLREAFEVR